MEIENVDIVFEVRSADKEWMCTECKYMSCLVKGGDKPEACKGNQPNEKAKWETVRNE